MAKKKGLTEDEIRWILSVDSSDAQAEIHKLSKANRELAKTNKERSQMMRELEAQGLKDSDAYRNLQAEINSTSKAIQKNGEKVNELTKKLDVNGLTMSQLRKKAKDLRSQLDNTVKATHPEQYAALENELSRVNSRMNDLRTSGQNAQSNLGGVEKAVSKLKTVLTALLVVKFAGYLKDIALNAYETRKEFAKYEAVLRNTLQSQEKAAKAMKMIQQLAADTPYAVSTWTEAYIKLINRGIKPTSDELTSMGDIASSQGKNIDQLIEAVLDAMTGENERLKEFGIRAEKNGDKVKYTFRGVTTEVANSEEAIKNYLVSLGQLDGVTGSMAVQMKELEGLQSNWGDTVDSISNKIGKYFEPALKKFFAGLIKLGGSVSDWLDSASDAYSRQMEKCIALETTIPGLISRYEELRSQTSLSSDEQEELRDVMTRITTMVPGAITAFDQYGNAIELSTGKVQEFVKAQKDMLLYKNQEAIKEAEKNIRSYKELILDLTAAAEAGGKVKWQSNGTIGGMTSYIDKSTIGEVEKELSEYGALLRGAEQSLAELRGDSLENAISARKAENDARSNFNSMTKKQLEAWLLDEENAANKYRDIARDILEVRAKMEVSTSEKKSPKKKKKTPDQIDKERIQEMQAYYQEDMKILNQHNEAQQIYLKNQLTTQKITQEQYDTLSLSLAHATAEERIKISENALKLMTELEVSNSKLKYEAVTQASDSLLAAENQVAESRMAITQQVNSMMKDFKDKFRLTTVDEDLEMQMQVLEAAYQSRLELAKKHNLDTTEIDSAYYRAKEQLESDHENRIYQIRDQYGLTSQAEQYELQLEMLRQHLDQGYLLNEEYEQAVVNLKRDSYKNQFDYYSSLFSNAVGALQDAEMANVDAKYDAEIAAAEGNAEEIERLETEKAQKKLDIEKKYADLNFAIKASQIISDTAVSIMKALADLGPIAGPVAAGLMGVTGAAQLLAANAERTKIKNMSLSSSTTSSSATRVAGKQEGGKIDVQRDQDGKFFKNADYNPSARGFIDKPTVIVGEGPVGNSREWVASNAAVDNPTVAPILSVIDKAQQAGNIRTLDLTKYIQAQVLSGRSTGGKIDNSNSSIPTYNREFADKNTQDRLVGILEKLAEDGVPSYVLLDEFEKQTKLRNRSRKIGSK